MLPETYAEIDLAQLFDNFIRIKSEVARQSNNDILVCSIVKANAYGHGMVEAAKRLLAAGTDYLGTANYNESLFLNEELKKSGKKNPSILCLGILPEEKNLLTEVVTSETEVSVSSLKSASALNTTALNSGKRVNIHVKIDTGMNRIGFLPSEIIEAIRKMRKFKGIKIKGIYSHLATSEIPNDSYTKKQIKLFKKIVNQIEDITGTIELKHIQNSGAILNFKDDFFNMVRPGIMLYGYYPDIKKLENNINIKPVMTLKSKIKHLKKIPSGESISYGRKFKTKRNSLIASLPIGYGDGFSRSLSNKGMVYIKNKLCPVIGTVCMDWILIDVTGSKDIKTGVEVEIFGKRYPAYKISELLGTIPYEITCMIAPRVERVYIN